MASFGALVRISFFVSASCSHATADAARPEGRVGGRPCGWDVLSAQENVLAESLMDYLYKLPKHLLTDGATQRNQHVVAPPAAIILGGRC